MGRHIRPLWTCCLLACMMLAACGKDNDPAPPIPPAAKDDSRTVLVYLLSDNNLGSRGLDAVDVSEMRDGFLSLDGDLREKSNLLIYWDGGSAPQLLRAVVSQDATTLEEVKNYGEELTSTDPAVMKRVFRDAYTAFPAARYGLVVWSHGDGWIPPKDAALQRSTEVRWIGADWDNRARSEYSYGQVSDLASALEVLPGKLDFLLFDACYMLSVEVAYELRNCTDYIVACPTEIPGPGAPYHKIMPALFAADRPAEKMAEAYYRHYEETYDPLKPNSDQHWTGGASMGVIDCARLEALAGFTAAHPPQEKRQADVLRNSVFNCDKRRSSQVGYYDLAGLMKEVLAEQDYKAWTDIYRTALVWWQTTPENYSATAGMFPMDKCQGVSCYIPSGRTYSPTQHDTAYRETAWSRAAGADSWWWH